MTDDYDELGGQAWDGWPWVLAGHVLAILVVVGIAVALVAAADRFWMVWVFGGAVTPIFIVASLEHDWRCRKAHEARLIAQRRPS
jgi:hypothetical protein